MYVCERRPYIGKILDLPFCVKYFSRILFLNYKMKWYVVEMVNIYFNQEVRICLLPSFTFP